MLTEYITLAAVWVFFVCVLIAIPWMSRKNVLFGVVFSNTDIYEDEKARQIRRSYLLTSVFGSLCVTAAGVTFFILNRPNEGRAAAVYIVLTLVLLLFETVLFALFHRRVRALKKRRGPDDNLVTGTVSVDTQQIGKKAVASAAWILLLLPGILTAWLIAVFGYGSMPERLPVHYNMTAVDGWAQKSWLVVLSPAVIGTVLAALLALCTHLSRYAPASVRGNPEAAPEAHRYRKYMIALLIVIGIVAQLPLIITEIGFIRPVAAWWINLSALLILPVIAALFYIYFKFVRAKKPKGRVLDDDAKWVLGMFYYDPGNSAVFIEKRSGIGYTLNFGHPAGWVILLLIIGLIAVATITARYR